MPKEAGLNKQGSHFSSQDTFTHFVPVNINLPSSHQSQRTPQGVVTKDGYEGLKDQLMKEIEVQIKRILADQNNQQFQQKLQHELNESAHKAVTTNQANHGVIQHHSKMPSTEQIHSKKPSTDNRSSFASPHL